MSPPLTSLLQMEILLQRDKLESVLEWLILLNINMEASSPKGGRAALAADGVFDRFYETLNQRRIVLHSHFSWSRHSDFCSNELQGLACYEKAMRPRESMGLASCMKGTVNTLNQCSQQHSNPGHTPAQYTHNEVGILWKLFVCHKNKTMEKFYPVEIRHYLKFVVCVCVCVNSGCDKQKLILRKKPIAYYYFQLESSYRPCNHSINWENSQENRFTNMQIGISAVEKVEGSACTPCLSNRLEESAYHVSVTGLKKWVLCM